ncbi:CLUMA_CG013325, isoform A [Clunio marinus]|uniref:CLUMA_CG013325, isoform A n=1 Tax=Clunio marinus TaxID=568069 RepID=A0A1J1IIH9_9DIPT|nr:CLUMA_CG013325, isoform A [Clunio marinus]
MRLLIFFLVLFSLSHGLENIDKRCVKQYLQKVQLLDENGDEDLITQKCETYIESLKENFYNLWQYHYKFQHPIVEEESSIQCFIEETKKWQLHDRYLLDLLLRDNETNDKKLKRRNNYIFERLKSQALIDCKLDQP